MDGRRGQVLCGKHGHQINKEGFLLETRLEIGDDFRLFQDGLYILKKKN